MPRVGQAHLATALSQALSEGKGLVCYTPRAQRSRVSHSSLLRMSGAFGRPVDPTTGACAIGSETRASEHARAAPLALLATIRARRTGSGVRALRAAWSTTSAAIAGLVRHPACTATGRIQRLVRSQYPTT